MVKKLLTFAFCFLFLTTFTFAAKAEKTEPRNVILFIADGTGPTIMHLLMQYAKLAPKSSFKDRQSALEQLINEGKLSLVHNDTAFSIVSDSAAAATQFATGHKTQPEALGVDKDLTPVSSVLIDSKGK